MTNIIVDASTLVTGFLSDEPHTAEARLLADAYAAGDVTLTAPTLLPFEFTNSLLKAVRRESISIEDAVETLEQFGDMSLQLCPASPSLAFAMAHRFGRSAYDAAYLALAEEQQAPLITADECLYNAAKDTLPWVVWLPEWRRRVGGETDEKPQGAAHE